MMENSEAREEKQASTAYLALSLGEKQFQVECCILPTNGLNKKVTWSLHNKLTLEKKFTASFSKLSLYCIQQPSWEELYCQRLNCSGNKITQWNHISVSLWSLNCIEWAGSSHDLGECLWHKPTERFMLQGMQAVTETEVEGTVVQWSCPLWLGTNKRCVWFCMGGTGLKAPQSRVTNHLVSVSLPQHRTHWFSYFF